MTWYKKKASKCINIVIFGNTISSFTIGIEVKLVT